MLPRRLSPDGAAGTSADHRVMRPRIVILGAGTGGTLTANRLQRHFGDDAEIVVIDHDDRHVYQPALLFVPFGLADPEEIVRPRSAQLHAGIDFRIDDVQAVQTSENLVQLASGEQSATTSSSSPQGRRYCPERPRA